MPDINAIRREIDGLTEERDALRQECESLRGKLECLPQTEDGHPIVPGMTLYIANPTDWHRPDLVKDGRPILTYFTAKDYEVHPHYSRYKMFADSEAAKVDAEKDRAAASAAKEQSNG